MNPKQRMLALRLAEKLAQNPEYARTVGVEISNKKTAKEIQANPLQCSQKTMVSNTIY